MPQATCARLIATRAQDKLRITAVSRILYGVDLLRAVLLQPTANCVHARELRLSRNMIVALRRLRACATASVTR